MAGCVGKIGQKGERQQQRQQNKDGQQQSASMRLQGSCAAI